MNSPNVNSFHYGDISTDEDEEDNIEIEDVLLLSDNINSYHYGINDSTSEVKHKSIFIINFLELYLST